MGRFRSTKTLLLVFGELAVQYARGLADRVLDLHTLRERVTDARDRIDLCENDLEDLRKRASWERKKRNE